MAPRLTRALRLRDPDLVLAMLGYLVDYEDDPDVETSLPWRALVDTFTTADREWKTVENTLYDLAAFGAIHRIGQAGTRTRSDTRAVRSTPLGRAWLEQTLLPLPNPKGSTS